MSAEPDSHRAHQVRRVPENQGVAGSSPALATAGGGGWLEPLLSG